jgi:choline dehydrogenase-like flavoprotein
MRLQDCDATATLDADLCVIGSGPAGATLAAHLAGSSHRVLVVESGGDEPDPALAPLWEIESTGQPRVMEQSRVRARTVGGTSCLWSGRCVPFEPIDFEPRDWVPHSGWPIGLGDLEPYLDRAAALMRLGPNRYDDSLWPLLSAPRPQPPLDDDQVVSSFWQYSRDPADPAQFLHFGRLLRAIPDPNVRLLTGATVTHLNTDPAGSRMTSVEVADTAGRRSTVTARAFVLCAGGIENARLMLASNRARPAGVGNARDQVGRFLMDHPRCTLGEFAPADVDAVLARFGIYQLTDAVGPHPYSLGLALSPTLQRSERLLNCAAWLTEERAADDPWDAINRLRSGDRGNAARDLRAVVAHPGLLARGLRRRLVGGRGVVHKIDRLLLDCIVEQRPDPDSRLTLSDRCDPLGVPLSRLHWVVSDQERWTVIRFGRAIVDALGRAGLPTPRLVDWVARGRPEDARFRDVAHPTGTTRMSADPASGVVDVNGQVHGVQGLYVAGSSVFPTSGHGNPTLMLVALAIRLAEHLTAQLGRPTAA